MKQVIAIIDVNELPGQDIDLEKAVADITLYPAVEEACNYLNRIGRYFNVKVRPLPEMKDADDETDMSGGDDYASGYRDGWDRGIEIGWNRYRKAITGEEE